MGKEHHVDYFEVHKSIFTEVKTRGKYTNILMFIIS